MPVTQRLLYWLARRLGNVAYRVETEAMVWPQTKRDLRTREGRRQQRALRHYARNGGSQ